MAQRMEHKLRKTTTTGWVFRLSLWNVCNEKCLLECNTLWYVRNSPFVFPENR